MTIRTTAQHKKQRGIKAAVPGPATAPQPANLTLAGRSFLYLRIVAALLSGLLLGLSYPPARLDLLAWLALLPLLLVPQPRRWRERFFVGYLFGYLYFAWSLFWLNQVGFGAGFLLALWCALFPMLWYVMWSAIMWHCKGAIVKEQQLPGAGLLFLRRPWQIALLALLSACIWVACEWLRAWLFTGIPWNELGISQYRRIGVIQVVEYCGVHGVSFLIVFVNVVLAAEGAHIIRHWLGAAERRGWPWHLLLAMALSLPLCWLGTRPEALPSAESSSIRILAVQGNLPQCRFWTEEQCQDAQKIYSDETRKGLANSEFLPDLVLWPECAVPATLDHPPYRYARQRLLEDIKLPMLIGATQFREDPLDKEEPHLFNSAFLLSPTDSVLEYYDKIHRVPFGEFTPFGDYVPWLRELIGMGRDLTPGLAYHVFQLPKGAKAGVSICFEDVFPYLSREFVRRGANLLMTITNDSWYNQSSGAEQHLSHVVFRAIENRRPLLRSGNNSHSCLITPNGRVLGLLRDETSGSLFVRGAQLYEVPVDDSWGTTFYTRHGPIFARLCVLVSMICWLCLLKTWHDRKRRQYLAITAKLAMALVAICL
jgi:apolipoprotein N-acyltransferase